jgi:undecaprenyl-diphosphatase
MNLIQALILGIVQGLTEFLPISSSAHLVLIPYYLGWNYPTVTFDIFVHLATLLAVIAYFYSDVVQLIKAAGRLILKRQASKGLYEKLFFLLIIGTIPAIIGYFAFGRLVTDSLESPLVVAILLLFTGLILLFGERLARNNTSLERFKIVDTLTVGTAQALALFPGISRSAATISAGIWRGLDRPAAARFSFLLAIPIIVGGTFKELANFVWQVESWQDFETLFIGFIAAAASAFLAINYLLKYLRKGKLYIFAIYCFLLGSFSLIFTLIRQV